jgi:hypothetical protein
MPLPNCLCPLSLPYFLSLFSAMFCVSKSIPDPFLLPPYSSLTKANRFENGPFIYSKIHVQLLIFTL